MRALPFRLLLLPLAAALSACMPHPRPGPLPYQAPPHRPGAANANDILFRAIGLVGTPYRYGGNTPDTGFDCSGLVDFVFHDVAGVSLPRTAQEIGELDAPRVGRGD